MPIITLLTTLLLLTTHTSCVDILTSTLELDSVHTAQLLSSLSRQLDEISIPTFGVDQEEMEGRLKTASVEIEASSSMWTKISETTMASARDLSLVRQAVARFVQAPTVEKVTELDTATATASQSASFLSFALQHGCQASSEAEHALDALFNATYGHEAKTNRTMDVLGSRLRSMIEVQRNVENEILTTTFSIEAELPKKVRGEILPELWNVGNATGKKNEGRTRSLLSALRNVTLSKYYANTLSERIVGVVRTTMEERSIQKKKLFVGDQEVV